MKNENRRRSHRWAFILVFLLLTGGILGGGFYYYRKIGLSIKTDLERTLISIANLKVDVIDQWRKKKTAEAAIFSEKAFYLASFETWLDGRNNKEFRAQMLEWMEQTRNIWDYHSITIINKKGNIVLHTGQAESNRMDMQLRRLYDDALNTGAIKFGDFYRCRDCGKIHVDIVAPLRLVSKGGKSSIFGVAVFKIDPDEFLYPLIQSWPVPSRTAETLLVTREGDDVVYLNELRHSKSPPLSLKLPITRQELPAVKAALGQEGVVEGIDYRGMKVIAALKKIPGCPWSLIAKIDYDEGLAPFHDQVRQLLIIIVVLIACTGSVVYALFNIIERSYFKQLFTIEAEKRLLLQRFEYLIREAGDVILLINEDGHIEDFNEKALQLYGYDAAEMSSLKIGDLVRCESGENGEISALDKKEGIYEAQCLRKDGSTFSAEINEKKLDMEGKRYVQAIIRDISKRKKAEHDLIESLKRERFLADLVRNASLAIAVNHPDGSFEMCNAAFQKLTGYSEDELKNIPWNTVLTPPEWLAPEMKALEELQNTGVPVHYEKEYIRKNGVRVPIELVVHQFLDETGNVTHYFAFIADITERKTAAESVARSNRELELFAHVASHDLQEPLRKIMAFGDRLRRQCGTGLDENSEDSLSRMEGAAQRMRALIDGLLLYSRISSNLIPFEPTDLNKILELTLSDLEVRISETGARIEAASLPVVLGNTIQLGQLFQNIISNSLKFKSTDKAPLITIGSRAISENLVEITFQDNGIGFDTKYLELIFKPFQRLHGRAEYEGIGIGLTICQKIMTQHGGEITAESSPGDGAKFIVRLPVV